MRFSIQGPAKLFYNNTSEIMLENSKKPTYRNRHIGVQNFSLQEWVELEQVILEHIITHPTLANTYTKAIGWVLHNIHTGKIMGEEEDRFAHRE